MSYRNKPSLGQPSVAEVYRAMTKAERFFFWLALANFGAVIVSSFALGGNALSGKVRGDRFFLGDDGVLTPVSKGVYLFSWAHTVSMLVTHAFAVVLTLKARRRARRG